VKDEYEKIWYTVFHLYVNSFPFFVHEGYEFHCLCAVVNYSLYGTMLAQLNFCLGYDGQDRDVDGWWTEYLHHLFKCELTCTG